MHRAARVSFWILGIAVGLVFLKQMLGHYGGQGGRFGESWRQPGPLPAALATAKPRPLADSLTIELRPRQSSFDSLFMVDVIITNRSASPVRNVAIRCDALGANGDTTGHATTMLHEVFSAHATKTEMNVGLRFIHAPASARCAIADFVVDQ